MSAIDWSFIKRMEGYSLNGYVPASGVSGVTIISGFDLGQHSIEELQDMGINEVLCQKLKPYLGLKQMEARNSLRTPLTLTQQEGDELEAKSNASFVQGLSEEYTDYSGNDFDSLSVAQQTVIADVAFQYGLNLQLRCPHFWSSCTQQDWPSVVTILQNFGDAYETRRNAEAQLLINERK